MKGIAIDGIRALIPIGIFGKGIGRIGVNFGGITPRVPITIPRPRVSDPSCDGGIYFNLEGVPISTLYPVSLIYHHLNRKYVAIVAFLIRTSVKLLMNSLRWEFLSRFLA